MPEAIFQELSQTVDILMIPMNQTVKLQAPPQKADYDWIFFTSVNAVNYFDFSQFNQEVKTVAIGNQTTKVLIDKGYQVTFQPKEGYSEGLIHEWLAINPDPQRILWPHSLHARRVIYDQLNERGHMVLEQVIYKNEFSDEHRSQLTELFRQGDLDYVLFASPSAWESFYQTAKQCQLPNDFWENLTIAAIGPVTANVIRQAGYLVAIQPEIYDMPHLYACLLQHIKEPIKQKEK
ncbi:uroporphyrinogen-III synthase [Enterococcus florum]|nr:uroporphyrinogen-III synthase [Enterococcus florum]